MGDTGFLFFYWIGNYISACSFLLNTMNKQNENRQKETSNFLFSRKEKLGASKTKEILKSMELLRKTFSLKMCWCGWTEEGCPLWQMWAILAEWGRSLFTYKDFIWIWTMESPDCFHSYWTQIYSKISSNGCWDQYLAQM